MFWDKLRQVPQIMFHPEAVWIEDCDKQFYLSGASAHDGSTLIASKTTGKVDRDNPITVRCINFSRWMQDNLRSSDYVILKLDIEGAEYDVLQRMLDDGSISIVKKLYIEFHQKKIGLPKQAHDQLVLKLRSVGLAPHAWDALGH